MDWPQFVIALSILIGAITTMIVQLSRLKKDVKEVHVATNSRMDELVEEVRRAALLAGAQGERVAQAARDADRS
jgi:hypothetical protein